jgi:hypothetical protein
MSTIMRKRTANAMSRTILARYVGLVLFTVATLGSAKGFAAVGRPEPSTGSSRVFAQVGSHKIGEQEIDSTIRLQLYNLRKQAIDQAVANYLIEDAARENN